MEKIDNAWEIIPYTIVDEEKEIINFNYSEQSFTTPIDCDGRISSDNDAGFTFDTKYIIDIDEEKQELYIEQ